MLAAPALTTDLATAYRELSDLRAAVLDGDWVALRRLVDGQRPATRTEMISYAGSLPPTAPLAQRQVEADPADGLAAALLGECLIVQAWEVRTGYQAQHVSQNQFREFHQILRGAEQMLIDAAAYRPDDPAIWYCGLTTDTVDQAVPAQVRVELPARDPEEVPQPPPVSRRPGLLRRFRSFSTRKKVRVVTLSCIAAGVSSISVTVLIAVLVGQAELSAFGIIGSLLLPPFLVGSVVRVWKEPG